MRRIVASAVTVAVLLIASIAVAIPPRVLIVFDTSGSMIGDHALGWSCHGDGSVDFPGDDIDRNGRFDDSKMWIAKEAVSALLLAGHDIEWGLMRYHQQESAGITPGNDTYYPRAINYSGRNACLEGADLLVPISGSSTDDILEWIDHRESWPADGELRASGYTPLGNALDDAYEYLRTDLIPSDPQSGCRNYYVLLITDGVQECPAGQDGGDPLAAASDLRDVTVGGESWDVRTFVVGFGPGLDGAEQLNRIARNGGTAINDAGGRDLVRGRAYYADDAATLDAALEDIAEAAAPVEVCDGRDNDCDRSIDEGFDVGESCTVGVGACERTGTRVCSDTGSRTLCDVTPGTPRAEVCDGIDNDCNGAIDDGLLNACGSCGPTPAELCNGEDDDCDGSVDEGVRNACGGCGAVESERCDGIDNDCDGSIDEGVANACGGCGPVPEEICDGEDNDCDRLIDEGFGRICGDCTPDGPETCDFRDNDCDGEIDEGLRNACGTCGAVHEEICNGADDDCDGLEDEGTLNACGDCFDEWFEVCDGEDNDCDGAIDEDVRNECGTCGPVPAEVCDNYDNDCDGEIDNDAECPPGRFCVDGDCVEPCVENECPVGLLCVDGLCIDPCGNLTCPDGTECVDGDCIPSCVDVICPEGEVCTDGVCLPWDGLDDGAGADDADAGGTGDGADAGMGDAGTDNGGRDITGGSVGDCGCATDPSPGASAPLVLAFIGLLATRRRRR